MSMVKYTSSKSSLITITETSWLKFNITLPPAGTGLLTIKFTGYAEGNRVAIEPTGGFRSVQGP